MIVVIATRNPGKSREIADALGAAEIQWRTLDDYPPVDEPEETGATFLDNARLKAAYYAAHTGELTLAEDSGLEVAALDGQPGVHSARYAGERCDDAANNAKVLAALADVPAEKRTARFVSTFVLVDPDGAEHTARGEVHGHIADACAGAEGFGYDALFVPAGYDATFGVLGLSVKREMSHRARALRVLLPVLHETVAACGSAS